MANLVLLSFIVLIKIFCFNSPGAAQSSCNGPCGTSDDCVGQLACTNGRCNDDPEVGTHICSGSPPFTPSPSRDCQASGTLTCSNGNSYPTYTCSPPVTGSTSATLTNNDFIEGGDGGAPSECDSSYHSNTESVVALSTGWYEGGSRCGKTIIITASNGISTTAMVVDECDSTKGCDQEHANLSPCDNNIVDGSDAVWKALGLDVVVGKVSITWAMA